MRHAWVTRLAAIAALTTALSTGAGCTWVRKQTGLGDDTARGPEPPGMNKPYPNLATVPSKTPDTGTTRERLQIEQGLLADRRNARHVSGPVAGETQPSSLMPEEKTRPAIINPRSPAEARAAAASAARATVRGGPVGSITYAKGSSALPEGSGRMIVQAAALQQHYKGTVVVVGHAARSEGDAAARKQLAQQRATAVANGLLNLGVDRSKIRVGTDNGAVDAPRVDIALILGR
jgi:outer membrane protein OmpA-like peptidoglycan-associated protein